MIPDKELPRLRPYRHGAAHPGFRYLFVLIFSLFFGSSLLQAQEVQANSSSSDIIDRSLELDIMTSNRGELEAWCRILELDDEGGDEALRQRLSLYYGLGQSGLPPVRKSPSGTRVVIESARRSEYLQVDIDTGDTESIVRLSGEVVISVSEPDRGRSHRVEADSVIFNQKQNTISAMGNILYTVDTGGREENFSGDSLTFLVTDWTGVIFRGTSERQQDVDGENIDFFFRGESIQRSGQDILILNDGVITSDENPNPDYALKAKKIWITGPGEWGFLSATLYVGHVPVLYIPFYWKSGSDMIFNPVIGFRSRVGYYIQTTSYILGRKEKDDGFSIMGFGDSASSGYELTREGLFLVSRPSSDAEEQAQKNTLKYMLDIYTSLGAMTGFVGDFPAFGKSGSANFYATIGVSRSIDSNGSIYFDDGTTTRVFWNDSYLGKNILPFRWGTKFDFAWDKWSLYMDWYSDPYYLRDFGKRSENFDWLSLILGEEGTDVDVPDLVTDMTWEIKGSESVNLASTSPWLQTLSLDNFRTSLTWKNKPNQDVVLSSEPDRAYDPARDFYYPDRLVLPDLKLSLRGGSPNWKINRLDVPDPIDPLETDGEVDDTVSTGPDSVPYHQSFDAVYSTGLLNASLNYGLQGQLFIEDRADSTTWNKPSDIDFSFEAARINSTQLSDLSYKLDFWDGLTGLSGTTNLSGYYQTHSDIFGNDAVIDPTTRLEDYRYTKLLWDTRYSVYFKPFQGLPSLSDTSLNYSMDANLFSREFSDTGTAADPGYTNSWISSTDDFRQHEASVTAGWKPSIFNLSLTGTADIPPLDQRYTLGAAAGIAYEGFQVNISQQNSYENSDWSLQPLIMNASWTFWKNEVNISQSARFDAENSRISDAETKFGFWGFETQFVASHGVVYNWDTINYLWIAGPENFRPSTLRFSYRRDFEPPPSWKNRLRTKTILDTSWNINLNQPTDNVFGFRWTQEFHLYKFIDLQISFSSTNRSMYLYFPWWRDELGIPGDYNFFEDLLKSFNIFNRQDRLDSNFNMDSLDLAIVHHLRNWDMTIEYSGWPALDTGATNYRWKSEFSLYVKWNPLPMFNQRTQFSKDFWSVESFK